METLFLIFNGCATSHVTRLRKDAAHLGLQPTLEITWAFHSNFRSQRKYCFLTLSITRGGRHQPTDAAVSRLLPCGIDNVAARRRVHAVVRRHHHLLLPWFGLPAMRPGPLYVQGSSLAGRNHVVWRAPNAGDTRVGCYHAETHVGSHFS